MAKKVLLQDWDKNEILPITRGELILDSSGEKAFHSNEFLATTSQPGLMSAEDKNKLDNFSGKVSNDLTLKINSGTTEDTSLYTYNGSAAKTLDIKAGSNITLTAAANALTIAASDTKVTQENTTDDSAYRVLLGNNNDTTETTTVKKSANLLFNPSTGTLAATTFQGNLDGTYVNTLTGYTKATSASDLAATDTLNAALGKLEYKADTAYDWIISVTTEDTDKYVNKWQEILDFLNKVDNTEGADITDEFVTRKTDQTITGIKTFTSKIYIQSLSDYKIILNNTQAEESKIQGICFQQEGVQYGVLQTWGTDDILWNNDKIWHEGNDGAGSGLDADLLDGKHATEFFQYRNWNDSTDYNTIRSNGLFISNPADNASSINTPHAFSNILSFGTGKSTDGYGAIQISFSNATTLFARNLWNSSWSNWKQIAFTDDAKPSGYVASNTAGLSSYWGKLWECTRTANYNDLDITFYIHTAYNNRRGFIHIRVRRSVSTTNNVTTYSHVVYMQQISGNIPSSSIRLYHDATTGKMELWVNIEGQYGVYNATIISCTDRVGKEVIPAYGTLYTNTFNTVQTLPSYGYISLSNSKSDQIQVTQHTSNLTEYPLVWTNSANTVSDVGNQLYKSYNHLTYNPSLQRITVKSINSNLATNTHLAGNQGTAIINSTATAGAYTMLAKMNSTNGYFTQGVYGTYYGLYYTNKSVVDAGTNTINYSLTLLGEDGDSKFPGKVTASQYVAVKDGFVMRWGASLEYMIGSNSTSDFYLWSESSAHLRFGTNNLERLRITKGGLIGIGTTSPEYSLDVNGDIAYKGTLYMVDNIGKFVDFDGISRPWYGFHWDTSATNRHNMQMISNYYGMTFHSGDYTGTIFAFAQGSGDTYRENVTINNSGNIFIRGITTSTGFIKSNSSDSYVLLGGGGHKALSDFMMKSDELTNNLTTITKNLTVTQEWMDTGISGTDLTTGTYVVQVYSHATNNSIWYSYWSGIMTWYGDRTNSSETDEIILHRGAHAYNSNTIYLRTINSTSTDGRRMRLQIAANKDFSSATYTFKFKRVI